MVKGIIFDFDGVVVDSEVPYVSSVVAYLKTIGIETTFEQVQHVVGQNLHDIASELKEEFNIEDSIEKIIEDSTKVYDQMTDIKTFPPMVGIVEFVRKCQEKGIKMSVASSSGYEYLDIISKNIGIRDCFDFLLSGEDFEHSKPDPEIYNIAAEKMGIDKKDLIIIEDSVNGIKAGLASGIKTIGIKASRVIQDTSAADEEVHAFSEINLD